MGMLPLSSASALPALAMTQPGQATGGAQPAAPPGQDFASVLRTYAAETAAAVRQGESAAIAGVQGQLPLQDMVQHVMAAERALQTALAVRDKAVGAYLEISRMQI